MVKVNLGTKIRAKQGPFTPGWMLVPLPADTDASTVLTARCRLQYCILLLISATHYIKLWIKSGKCNC